MKIYAITIKPESAFGTPLKGDTIFGNFCWQAIYDDTLLSGGFEAWIDRYQEQPFAVFSSAWPKITTNGISSYCLPAPTAPTTNDTAKSRSEKIRHRKEDKKRRWWLVKEGQLGNLMNCTRIDDKQLFEIYKESTLPELGRELEKIDKNNRKLIIKAKQQHNSINRLTMTTGNGFDPYISDNIYFLPGLELTIFVAIDGEATDIERVKSGLARVGKTGYGRDASSGLGRFLLDETELIEWPKIKRNEACYTLAPCVPETGRYSKHYATPFTRFGRHGGELVLTKNPFKNPIVMADEGALFFPTDDQLPQIPYIGQAVTGISLIEEKTVTQGYALYLPYPRR